MADDDARRARARSLVAAAKTLQDPRESAGQALRRRLAETSGLSPQNIELGLSRCLEATPAPEHLTALLASTPEAPAAHVLLSANVFVAALRAIIIGAVASSRVVVRASRRDPALAEALHALAPESFQLVAALAPNPGDHVWAYGSNQTLDTVRRTLPSGTWFHGHGAGFGAVAIAPATFDTEQARALALDTALFDQRGCLSPRVLCVVGSAVEARDVARAVAQELASLESTLPPGPKTAEELAEQRPQRDSAAYAFELFDAGSGWVTLGDRVVLPPATRCLHVTATHDAADALRPFAAHLTNIAANTAELARSFRSSFGGARVVALGEMQRPPLDGPVDLRDGSAGYLL